MNKLVSIYTRFTNSIRDNDLILFIYLLGFRTINSFLLFTLFEPDEFYQNIEPAFFIIRNSFDLTWDWLFGIRSINFSLLFYLPIYIACTFNSTIAAYIGIKIANALIAAFTDYFTIKLGRLHGVDALFSTIISHGCWLYAPRSHINSFEMLSGVSGYFFIESYRRKNKGKKEGENTIYLRIATYIMVFCAYLRPSIVFYGIIPFLYCFYEMKTILPFLKLAPEIFLELGILTLSDSIFYREFNFVPYTFFKVNVLKGVSDLFGRQNIFSYIFFAFVLLGFTMIIVIRDCRKFKIMSAVIVLYIMSYSMLGHKEMRFILPIVPLCNIIAADSIKKYKKTYLLTLAISIYVGVYHQNFHSTSLYLQKEIQKYDIETNPTIINVRILLDAFVLPKFSFLANKKVRVNEISCNPVIFTKLEKKDVKKRFEETEILICENHSFLENVKIFIAESMEYDFLVMNRTHFELVKSMLANKFLFLREFDYNITFIPPIVPLSIVILKRIHSI